MKTREEHLNFITLNLNALSYCAWQGYRTKGRGAVCGVMLRCIGAAP